MDIRKILKTLESLEEKIAEWYQWLMDVFSSDPETRLLFYQMAKDEISHRDLIRYQLNLAKKNPTDFKEIPFDIDGIQELLTILDTILTTKPSLSLAESIKISLKLERNASEHHYRNAILESNPGLGSLLNNLGKADSEHHHRIIDFCIKKELSVDD